MCVCVCVCVRACVRACVCVCVRVCEKESELFAQQDLWFSVLGMYRCGRNNGIVVVDSHYSSSYLRFERERE